MSSDPVEELATVLGLTDDSFLLLAPQYKRHQQASKHEGRSIPYCREINALIADYFALVQRHFTGDEKKSQTRVYLNAFVSKYLPKLVRALLLVDPDALIDSPWFNPFAQVGSNAALAHFMRNHELAPRLQLHLLDILVSKLPTEAAFRSFTRETETWACFANQVLFCLFALFPTSTPRSPFPWSNLHTTANHNRHISSLSLAGARLERIRNEKTPLDPRRESFRCRALVATFDVRHALMSALPVKLETITRSELCWSSCDCYEKKEDCVNTGEDMMACSGCLTVRYCSRGSPQASTSRLEDAQALLHQTFVGYVTEDPAG